VVPHEQLFDIDFWHTSEPDFPRFVNYNESEHYDCNPETRLFYGACGGMDKYLNGDGGEKDIIFNRTGHYEHPASYGGGWGLGSLFYGYLGMDNDKQPHFVKALNMSIDNVDIESRILRAMNDSKNFG
jgi:hypothetical protein